VQSQQPDRDVSRRQGEAAIDQPEKILSTGLRQQQCRQPNAKGQNRHMREQAIFTAQSHEYRGQARGRRLAKSCLANGLRGLAGNHARCDPCDKVRLKPLPISALEHVLSSLVVREFV
jgi:hypothetical protein